MDKLKRVQAASFKIENEEQGTFRAVFATLGVRDKDGDVIMPGAIERGSKVRVSAYNHSSWGGALPVGKGEIDEVDNELVVTGQFFQTTEAGRETYNTVKELDDLTEWSFGFDTLDAEWGEMGGERVQFLKKLKVFEVSPVLLGAGVNTRTTEIKAGEITAGEGEIKIDGGNTGGLTIGAGDYRVSSAPMWIINGQPGFYELAGKGPVRNHSTEVRGGSWDGSTAVAMLMNDAPVSVYRDMFAWEPATAEDREDKSKWKLPHHSVDEGGNPGAANYRACVAGIAVLNGARGGADIPEGDRQGVYDHLAKHIRDFGEEPPELKQNGRSGGFRSHVITAQEVVEDVADRSREIKRLRLADGRDIGPERKRELRELAAAMRTAADTIEEAASDPAPESGEGEAAILLARIRDQLMEDQDGD
jgi:HK97 family phage prohead protease